MAAKKRVDAGTIEQLEVRVTKLESRMEKVERKMNKLDQGLEKVELSKHEIRQVLVGDLSRRVQMLEQAVF